MLIDFHRTAIIAQVSDNDMSFYSKNWRDFFAGGKISAVKWAPNYVGAHLYKE